MREQAILEWDGNDPNKLWERGARKRCLVIESRLNRDLDQGSAGLAHHLFGVVNAIAFAAASAGYLPDRHDYR